MKQLATAEVEQALMSLEGHQVAIAIKGYKLIFGILLGPTAEEPTDLWHINRTDHAPWPDGRPATTHFPTRIVRGVENEGGTPILICHD